MLGTRTKQVNAYGRRGSRIVNVTSDRRDREPEDSSEAASDADIPPLPRALRRENTIIISPAKPRLLRRVGGLSHSPRGSPLAQSRAMQSKPKRGAATKQMQSKLLSSTHVRQPLTPLRPNGISTNEQPSSGIKSKSRTSTTKPVHVGLKPHSPVIAVDIIVFDEDGNKLTQERRLSHTEIQTNRSRTATGKRNKESRTSLPRSLPIAISDGSDPEVVSPKPGAKRSSRRPKLVSPSGESEADDGDTLRKTYPVPLPESHSRSKTRRVEVVIPPAPSRESKTSKRPPNSPPLVLTPPKALALPNPAFRSGSFTMPSFLAPSILAAKSRQLTPIRGSSNRSLFRRPPSTPSTPTDSDLSLDLSHLDISDTTEIYASASTQPEYLLPLLNECGQTSPYEFSAFIETFPFDPVVQTCTEDKDTRFHKIGEASYSEVFGIGDVVLKIIPVRSEEESTHPEAAEIPAPSDAKDVLKEIIVTREIGEICDNFVKLLKTYVVRGRYPSLLLSLWDEYNERKGSESIRPDSFGLTQIYAIIILPNGGPDLESFAFKNVSKYGWRQACGIFWQVARALEQAERLVHFEHRDLHWGQILVKSIPVKSSTSKRPASRMAMDDARFGVKVTIIDLGLSRMNAVDAQGSDIYWTPFDSEIFEGEGDYQYDIYRMMRDLTGGAWKSYHPLTNVMWLHYLVTKLLHEKRLKRPGGKRVSGVESQAVSSTGYNERECYDCLVDMETLLGNCIASAAKGKKTRKTVSPPSGPKSARDVITYGTRQGWVL